MAQFMVRIVLHDATAKHYSDLHDAMATWLNALRNILGDSGRWFDLPDGEYYVEANHSMAGLRDFVVEIANGIKPEPPPSVTASSTPPVQKGAERESRWRLRIRRTTTV